MHPCLAEVDVDPIASPRPRRAAVDSLRMSRPSAQADARIPDGMMPSMDIRRLEITYPAATVDEVFALMLCDRGFPRRRFVSPRWRASTMTWESSRARPAAVCRGTRRAVRSLADVPAFVKSLVGETIEGPCRVESCGRSRRRRLTASRRADLSHRHRRSAPRRCAGRLRSSCSPAVKARVSRDQWRTSRLLIPFLGRKDRKAEIAKRDALRRSRAGGEDRYRSWLAG